jgi:hypothetical protein
VRVGLIGAGRCQYPLPPRPGDRGKSLAPSPPRHLYGAGKIRAGRGGSGRVGAKLPSLKSHASKKAHEIRKRLKKTGPSRKVKHSPKTDLEFSFLEPRTTGSHHVVPRDPHVQTLISRSYPTLKAKTYTRLLFQGLSNMLLT